MVANHSSDVLLGLDIGTSSTKTVIVDLAGKMLARAAREYRIDVPRPGWAEQDPRIWFEAAIETMRRALAQAEVTPENVRGIGLSGLMHGTVFLDQRGALLRPAIIWADQRSQDQVQQIQQDLGKVRLGQWTANPVATGFMLPTWLWAREAEPQICEQTAHLLLPKDYVRYRLTGHLGSEPSDASSTLLFDPAQRCWSRPLLDHFGIDPALLPPIHESADIASGLLPAVAEAVGLWPGTPVVQGAGDQAAQALGSGIVRPGILSSTIGTGGQLFAPTTKPTYDPDLRLHLFCHALPARWHLMAAILSAGLSLTWLRDEVLTNSTYQEMADAAAGIPAGAEGLFFLPYLAGERTPHMDPTARAIFVGLTLRHGRAHMIRAAMEGVVFALRQGLELMLEMGVAVQRVVASGGGARHPLWLQLQADIFNRPIYRTRTTEAAAVGAALLAGVGAGIFPDAETACRSTVVWVDQITRPARDHIDLYDAAYRKFCQLYPLLTGWHQS